MKNQPRGLEGTFRTAAEMKRQRAQLADAAIEEQLEVQTAFREHGTRLQVHRSIYIHVSHVQLCIKAGHNCADFARHISFTQRQQSSNSSVWSPLVR